MHTDSLMARGFTSALAGESPSHEPLASELTSVGAVCPQAWANLADRAIEPNVFFRPAWTRAASAHARGQSDVQTLLAWNSPSRKRLTGLLPVVSAWRALKVPLPMLVVWQDCAPLSVPLLDRDEANAAARGLIEAAGRSGARAILFPALAIRTAAAQALYRAAADFGLAPRTMNVETRAILDATQQPDKAIENAVGAKKLKELRRQRNRLADQGEVTFAVASSPTDVAAALEGFLQLEASGWKGRRGTALAMDPGNAEFVRRGVQELAACRNAEIATLARNGRPVAAAILLRHGNRMFFYKIAYDEAAAKMSPGVQLSLHITRHLCADETVDHADSTAVANHPMIEHIWRGRLQVADVLVPTKPGALQLESYAGILSMRRAARQAARRVLQSVRAR